MAMVLVSLVLLILIGAQVLMARRIAHRRLERALRRLVDFGSAIEDGQLDEPIDTVMTTDDTR